MILENFVHYSNAEVNQHIPSIWETLAQFNTKFCLFSYYCWPTLSSHTVRVPWSPHCPLCSSCPLSLWWSSISADGIYPYRPHNHLPLHTHVTFHARKPACLKNETNRNKKILTNTYNIISVCNISGSVKQHLKITVCFLSTQNFYFCKCTATCHKRWSKNVQRSAILPVWSSNTY